MNATATHRQRNNMSKKHRAALRKSYDEREQMSEREQFFAGIEDSLNDLSDSERWALVGTVNGMMWQAAHKFAYANSWIAVEDAHHEIMVQVFRRACVHQEDRAAFTTNAAWGIKAAKTNMLAKRRQTIDARSIDAPMGGDEGYTLADELHTDDGPRGIVWTQAEWDETLCVLDPRWRKIVELYTIHDMSFAQISALLGLTRERPKQIYRAAMARLRKIETELSLFDGCA